MTAASDRPRPDHAASPFDSASAIPYRLFRRRVKFFWTVFGLGTLGMALMASALFRDGVTVLKAGFWVLFAVLFYHLSFGFSLAIYGMLVQWRRRGDPLRVDATLSPEAEDLIPLASTALVMPVYNEDVSRVFEGLRIMFRSLEQTGHLPHFDFFVLSDSDNLDRWVEEEVAWLELCRQLNAFGRIFYRKRRQAINRKSGNIGDFCRRWGRRYRYTIVLDADSLMTGAAIVRLVRLMEKNPRLGILQTAPRLVRGESLFARLFQFSSRLYGPLFTAGMDYWQGRDSQYWGHNAIIRTAPFMDNCALPELPGQEPLGGRILSHDYVEAALMRKAGYHVSLLPDLEGSYEEGPPSLLDHLKRDRRWCQGNLQHFWLLFARGWAPLHRLNMASGILNYVVSPVWLLFLVCGSFLAFEAALTDYPGPPRGPMSILLGAVGVFLFLPKLAVIWQTVQDSRKAAQFGGVGRFLLSSLLEVPFFMLLAPILMIFHTRFVVLNILGEGVRWATQRRKAEGSVDWREAILSFHPLAWFGLAWGASAAILNPVFFWWLTPVLAGLLLAIPFSIVTSGQRWGMLARSAGLFLTPEETNPPWMLRQLDENLAKAGRRRESEEPPRPGHGLVQVLLDPYINALHVSLLRQRTRPVPESALFFEKTRQELLVNGPSALSHKDQVSLLYHPESLLWLNDQLWSLPDAAIAPFWRNAIRQYNLLTVEPVTPLYR